MKALNKKWRGSDRGGGSRQIVEGQTKREGA